MLVAIYHLELTKLAADKINAGQLKHIYELYLKSGHFGDNEIRKQVWDADEDVTQYLRYKNVADLVVDGNGNTVNQVLEHAFTLTQNFDRPWTENCHNIRWLADKNLRSSSVGDIFVIEGTRFVVDLVGFEKVK